MASFWQTLLNPDQDDNPERAEIIQAANALQVGEFQVLQLAFHHWYGRDLTQGERDGLFRSYMLEGRVPAYARHYARITLRAYAQGSQADRDPRYHRYDDDFSSPRFPAGLRNFVRVAVFLVLVMAGGIAFAQFAGKGGASVLPPYFKQDQVQGVTREARPESPSDQDPK